MMPPARSQPKAAGLKAFKISGKPMRQTQPMPIYIIEENHFGQVIQQALMRMPTAAIDQTMIHISGPTPLRSVTIQSGV